ncbi:hypothetical protein A2164_00435 [Candidatus Curtissbacteria bacterium RBG_13_35_7]|uniref:Uncharacterized protein n=1 Tax=Candidatus Curtissbacteria bacterium RBG_13_35_7 TaxID=1797705 RepID=A0A1F5G256_9BACT|nr:MAG: hypothetical protein A2164_00435 [Candidatus Curtissbacteria bacterium RBG_13_35_7]
MQKKILISLGIILIIFIVVFIYAFIISFKVVKQNTDKINADLKQQFQSIVRIPEVIPPSYKGFDKTVYLWEMETIENEVTTVIFTHDTGLSRYQDKIIATLKMPEGQDPSLFVKVMPAVVSDNQALQSAQNLEAQNLGPNKQIGYNGLKTYTISENSPQVTQIVWEFDKEKLTENSQKYYNKLYKYSEFTLKILYEIQSRTLLFLKP